LKLVRRLVNADDVFVIRFERFGSFGLEHFNGHAQTVTQECKRGSKYFRLVDQFTDSYWCLPDSVRSEWFGTGAEERGADTD